MLHKGIVDAAPRGVRNVRTTSRTLLLVEPDDDLAALLEMTVQRWGWSTIRECNAARVIELLRARVIDVMLIELWHPGATELACVPCDAAVVGMTTDVRRLPSPLPFEVLTMPFEADELMMALHNAAGAAVSECRMPAASFVDQSRVA